MKKLLFVLFFLCFSFNAYADEVQTVTTSSSLTIVGNDKDEHGCIGSAGYTWSEEKKECVRPWEENNLDIMMPGSYRDEHGCIGSAGYTWSEEKKECVRPWEENNEYINNVMLNKYNKLSSKFEGKFAKISDEKLNKSLENIDSMIESTKMSKISKNMQIKKITKLVFIKQLFEKELNSRY